MTNYERPDERYPINWNRLRHYIFHRDGYRCQICGRKSDLVCHHIKYLAHGGSSSPDNLITICKYCHNKIHNKE